ncbi:MAG: hypothetical protein MUF50_02010 [Planctomycetes bacterium]|jgi:uncharacterized membrane-anchored protein|nr:hypothetical protein [Planctomycetota bacterium]
MILKRKEKRLLYLLPSCLILFGILALISGYTSKYIDHEINYFIGAIMLITGMGLVFTIKTRVKVKI